jgi:anti-sigma B factor antagonist
VERFSGAAPPRQPGGSEPSPPAPLTVRIEAAGNTASVVALAGELDLSTLARMEGPLFEQLRARPGVVLDLTRVSFIDSSGIAILIQAFQASSNGTRMHTVIGRDSQVERVFRIAGIDRVLPLFFDRDEALGVLASGDGARGGDQIR